MQISDAPASVGLASDWNAFTVTITNNGDSEEDFSERVARLLRHDRRQHRADAGRPRRRGRGRRVRGNAFDLSQDGADVAARVELPSPAIGSGESEEFTVLFRVGRRPTAVTRRRTSPSARWTSLSFDLRLATFGGAEGDEGELIGSDDVTVGVKPLTINTSSAVKPVLGVPVTMTTTTTNNTGSHYGTVVTVPLWILDEGEGDDAPDTLRKATRHLRTMAQQTRTRIEVRAPAGTWIDLADTDLELHEMPFVTETLRNGHAFSVEWRFTFNDPSVIGTDKSITWASLALNLGWSLGPELRRSVRGGGSSNALLEEAAYFVGVARTALGIVPGTTPPAATPTPSATPPAQGESPAADNDDDSDKRVTTTVTATTRTVASRRPVWPTPAPTATSTSPSQRCCSSPVQPS